MKNGTLVIFDYELDYANNLMNYMNRKKVLPFTVQVFTDLLKLTEYLKDNKIEVLLITYDVDIEVLNRANIKNIYYLSEGKYVSEGLEYPSIYKFQSVENILDEILLFYVDTKTILNTAVQKEVQTKFQAIGVYSPLGNCGQTSFALSLGQMLASKTSVLYINLENFSALQTLVGKTTEKGLSELIYFLKERKPNLGLKIKSLTGNINQMDYIESSNCCMDLLEVKKEEWELLVSELNVNNNYEIVIFDIGFLNQDILSFMNLCNVIYMPIKLDFISESKIKEFENIMNIYDLNKLNNKIIKLNLPYDERLDKSSNNTEYKIEDLTTGIMGEYVGMLSSDYIH